MELIDREVLLNKLGCSDEDIIFKEIIDEAPLIDAVEVVFCKNCIYRATAKVNCKGFTICPASNMEITDNDYCSYGERRESEET